MIRTQRQTIAQEFSVIPITVTAVPQQVAGLLGPSSLITTVVFSLPTGAANSVFLGSTSGVTITSGLEIPPGNPQQYRVVNEREVVELESVLLDLYIAITCRSGHANIVPIIAWDLSQMWLVAAGNTAMTVGTFKEMWV